MPLVMVIFGGYHAGEENLVCNDGGHFHHVFRAGFVYGGLPASGGAPLGPAGVHRVLGMAGTAAQSVSEERVFKIDGVSGKKF